MKETKIYGVSYPVHSSCKREPDLYWYSNNLNEEPLEGYTPSGYCKIEDGSIVAIYNVKKGMAKFIFIPIALVLLIVAGVTIFIRHNTTKALEGTMLKVDTLNNNVITFNAIAAFDGSNVDIRFGNGKSPATIHLEGAGITSQPVQVQANSNATTIPIEFSGVANTTEAILYVETNGNTYTYPVIIEIFNNPTGGDSIESGQGLTSADNPFGGEEILEY